MGCKRFDTDFFNFLEVVHSKKSACGEKNCIDHYPGGMAMPNRNLVGDYRYGYQGEFAEKDEETGLNAFQLRMYDSRINRWISPDPYGQYHSPYMAMDNRPHMVADPDGGCTDCAECPSACGDLGITSIPSGQSIDLNIDTGHFMRDDLGSSMLNELVITPGIDAVNGISGAVDMYDIISRLERGAWTQDINNIILHRTDGPTSSSAINWWKDPRNKGAFGTHFIIDKDGTIGQTANLNNRTQHTHNGGSQVPKEYRGNVSSRNSIGIEVVGEYQENGVWDPPTAAQIESTAYLVRKLKHSYLIDASRVLPHIQVQKSKSPNEGVFILNAINGN